MGAHQIKVRRAIFLVCLLYTSDAADEGLGVDLGGRRIIKKKQKESWSYVRACSC